MSADIIDNFIPDIDTILGLGPWLVGLALAITVFTSFVKKQFDVRTPYTRKIFHFLIFSLASITQVWYGLSAVVLLGGIVSSIVVIGVLLGDGNPFFESLARETDKPYRKRFIIIPLITTALGGVIINIFFGQFAYIGYIVGGWGDAVGEPVGTRWGKHRYSVPSLFGVPAQRSWEGSAAVMTVSILVSAAALILTGYSVSVALGAALLIGIGSALVEAISNHGLDNLTMQVAAAAIAYSLLG